MPSLRSPPLPGSALLSLPEEVLAHVISFLPDPALVALTHVCNKLYRIGNAPLELRRRCLSYRYWHERHAITAKRRYSRPTAIDWKSLFMYRLRVELATDSLLNDIIELPTGRMGRFNNIADFGFDSKDCLVRNAEVGEDEVDDTLARRWYATEALRHVHRWRALEIWKRLKTGEDVPIEEALGAVDIYVTKTASPDLDDTSKELDRLATQFSHCNPDFTTLSTSDKALRLMGWMQEQGFRGAPTERYRALKNCLVGLTIWSVRTAIPLTLVAIFCAIARRISLKASPCGYPFHVLAIVSDEETGERFYFDPFSPDIKRLERETLEVEIARFGPAFIDKFLSPATTTEMVIRTADNMIETLQQGSTERALQAHGYPEVDENAALYAALTIMVVLRPGPVPINVVHHMTEHLPGDFPMDVRFLEEELLPKVEAPNERNQLKNVCNALRSVDVMPRIASRRNTPENREVRYRIGTVFRHIRYSYIGVIFGWNSTCQPDEGEEWIERMDVDTLSRGRKQPFYNVLVGDTSASVRYVAEENIIPVQLDRAPEGLSWLAGKYFKRFCRKEGCFISNIKHEYPDD